MILRALRQPRQQREAKARCCMPGQRDAELLVLTNVIYNATERQSAELARQCRQPVGSGRQGGRAVVAPDALPPVPLA